MGMNCAKCILKCKADCCRGPVPMPKEFVESHQPIRPIVGVYDLGNGMVAPVAIEELPDGKKGGVCPFLGFDNKCSVYNDRPFVCKKFGDESSDFMTCSFQSADGRIRSRQERRHIERTYFSRRESMNKRLEAGRGSDADWAEAARIAKDWEATGGKPWQKGLKDPKPPGAALHAGAPRAILPPERDDAIPTGIPQTSADDG